MSLSLLPLLSPFPLPSSPPSLSNRLKFIKRRRSNGVRVLHSSQNSSLEVSGEEVSRATLIWRAVKLPIYSVALIPLAVGAGAAYCETGIFFAERYFVLLASSVLIITWLNLSNDVYDFDTGADKNKKESVVNIIGSRSKTQIGAIISLLLGFCGLIWAFLQSCDARFFLLVTYAILCGYVYQCPPFRLSYQGLGEPLCFTAFGPFATSAFYFASGTGLKLNVTILSASVLVGITTTLILFCSHFHQIEGDLAVGKLSPLVRIGTKLGSKVVSIGIISLYILLGVFSLCKFLPPTSFLLCALTVSVGRKVVKFVQENHNDNVKIFMAKYFCVRLHALFGVALAFGLFLARRNLNINLKQI